MKSQLVVNIKQVFLQRDVELTHLMATLLPSITTGLKPTAGSLSGVGLGWLGLGLHPLGTSLGLFGAVWQVFISSSRMSLVWASWRRLSSTRKISLWEYPSLRKRSTLACCCWRSMADSGLESGGCAYYLSTVLSGVSAWGILLASLFWFMSVSTATACVLEQLTGVKRWWRQEATSVTHCKHRKPAVVSQGFLDKSMWFGMHWYEFALVTTTSWLRTQAQALSDVILVKKAPVTHTHT